MKHDTGKLQYRLIPPSALKALAEVLTYGATKYSPYNWMDVESERYMDALYRHLEAYRRGETHDKESGLSHLAHAMANISFLLEREETEAAGKKLRTYYEDAEFHKLKEGRQKDES